MLLSTLISFFDIMFFFLFSMVILVSISLVLVILSWSCRNFRLQGELLMISDFSPRRLVRLTNLGTLNKNRYFAMDLLLSNSPHNQLS